MKIYTTTEYNIENLLSFIETWSIWLPDLQRPFVWNTTQVRKLFDSLYNWYPVWFFLFWKTKLSQETHNIWSDNVNKIPDKVIIDWQQRLTSLYAVIKWKPVLDDDYKEKIIKLSFNPKGWENWEWKLEVSNSVSEKSSEWIDDISKIWELGTYETINNYFQENELNEEEKNIIPKNIEKLYNIKNIWFSALEISENVDIDVVSEIFVRINSEWKKLNQLDFILTLLSVHWDEWRKKIEKFAYNKNDKENKFEYLLEIYPWDIVKVLVSYTFYKWRLKDMYNLLKWRDTEDRTFKEELRQERIELLKKNLEVVIDQKNWNSFFKILIWLWFKNSKTINASNNILFSYIFYLIWKYRFKLEYNELEKYIWKYYVYLVLVAKYSSSTESTLEKELKEIEGMKSKEEFINYIKEEIDMWEDFWNTWIIETLSNASIRNNWYLVYLASKIKSNDKVLFSDVTISDLLDDNFKDVKKKFLDIHHIFPKNYLKTEFWLTSRSDTNQLANYVYLNYNDNIKISDKSPKEYYEEFTEIYWKEKVDKWLISNEIPLNFYELGYEEFLKERRRLMRDAIREYFDNL